MKRILLPFVFIFSSIASMAQLTVDNTTMTPAQLVQNVLVGAGVTVSNIAWNGSIPAAGVITDQAGQFSGVSTAGLTNGIIIGSGDVTAAIGPNIGTGTTLGGTGMSGSDPDLNAISTAGINDQAVLEFDFVPQGDSIKFRYVFASEEYPEYVCSNFNDVFGFFITGPNPAGGSYVAQNIALIPGSTLPVAINTVNPGVTGAFGTVGGCTSLAYAAYYVDNTGGVTVEYDGLTVVLEAKAAVTCGQTYHIKMAVGDAGDAAFDSGVFLEAGSFSSNAVDVTIATPTSTSFINGQIYEECAIGTTATFYLVRPDVTTADTIPFSYSGSATPGVDFISSTPDTLAIFPAGQDTATFGVTILPDGVPEGLDSLVVTVYNINVCGDTILSTGTLYINDPLIILTNVEDDTINCPGQLVNLVATASGSPLPMTYNWSGPGLTGSGLTASFNPTGTCQVIFTATDQCLFTGDDTATITLVVIPIIPNAGPDINSTCPGDLANLLGTATGGVLPYTYAWSNGAATANTTVSPTVTTSYILTVSDCASSATDTMTVNVPVISPYVLDFDATENVTCPGDAINLPVLVLSGGLAPYTYNWTNGDTDSIATYSVGVNPTIAGLTIEDMCNNDTTIAITLTYTVYDPLLVDVTGGDICFGANGTITIPVGVSGGAGGFTYVWDEPVGSTTIHDETGSIGIVTDPITGLYTVYITDQCGTISSDTATVNVIPCEITIPNIVTPNGDNVNDAIHILNLEYHPKSVFKLYNRWGQEMYSSDDYKNDYVPKELSDGVYFYIVKLLDGTEPSDYTGQIHVNKKK